MPSPNCFLGAVLLLVSLVNLAHAQTTYDLLLTSVVTVTDVLLGSLSGSSQKEAKDLAVGDTWENENQTESLTLVDASDAFARVNWAVTFEDERFDTCHFEYTFLVTLSDGFGQTDNTPVSSCFVDGGYTLQVEATLTVIANEENGGGGSPTMAATAPTNAPVLSPTEQATQNEPSVATPSGNGPTEASEITPVPTATNGEPASSPTEAAEPTSTACSYKVSVAILALVWLLLVT